MCIRDRIKGCRVEGEIIYDGRNINTREENLYDLRRSIGMVFQLSLIHI